MASTESSPLLTDNYFTLKNSNSSTPLKSGSSPSLSAIPQQIKISAPQIKISAPNDLQHAISMIPQQLNTHVSKFTSCRGLDITSIKTLEQFKLINSAENVIILDLRPFNQYNVSRVKGALSICVPTTLLKRSSFHLSNIFKTMIDSQEGLLQSKLENNQALNVIFYDSVSDFEHCSLHLHQIIKKFDDSINDYNKKINLFIVDHGFTIFQAEDEQLDLNKFKSNSKNLSSFTNFLLPTVDTSSNFMMSLKNNPSFPSFEGSKLSVPEFQDVKELPKWLQRYSQTDAISTIINNFKDIETMENARIVASVERRRSSARPSPSESPEFIMLNGSEFGLKNRYPNILPYEHSRVRLLPSPMSSSTGTPSLKAPSASSPSLSPNCDYFNANFISVPMINEDSKYIATQAPLPNTINDFWKVVWHNGVEVIITLTNLNENGYKKSDVYWQESSQVHVLSEENDFQGIANLTIRTIELTRRSHKRIIRQLQFKGWPDFGIIKQSEILSLINVKDQFISDSKSPIVVHCSAGCGRTGVFITIDLILESFRKSQHSKLSQVNQRDDLQTIDIWQTEDDLIYYTVQQLRKQRISMVQSLDQFVFCYESLLQYFSSLQN